MKVFEDEERAGRLADRTIIGRNSEPEDLVGACVFFCQPGAAYITGQTLYACGGLSLYPEFRNAWSSE